MMSELRQVECWACCAIVTFDERSDNDGDCPHCNSELDLECYLLSAKDQVQHQAAEISKLKEQLAKANGELDQNKALQCLHQRNQELTDLLTELKKPLEDIRREAILEAVEWYKNNFPYCEDDIYTFEKLIEYATKIGE